VVGVILVAVGNRGFMPTMIVISVAATVSTLYFLIVYGPIRLQFNRLITKVAFSKMWPTALAVIFNTFYLQGDRVILPIYVSQSEVGLYGSAYRVLDVVIQTAAMVMGLLMPLATAAWARHDLLTFRKRYQLSFDLMMALLLPMVVGAVVLATPLMRFVGGVEFAAAGPILVWLSVAMFAIIIGMTFGHLVLALNRQKQALWVYISTAILSVIAYFIFIPRYGVFGAAGVTVGAEFFAGLMLFAVASYYAKFFPAIKQFLKIVFASSVMGLLVYLIQSIHFLFSVALGAAIYLILIVSLKVVSHSTLKDVLGK
jgi:O-antigen/teichoic acid export membrane protein